MEPVAGAQPLNKAEIEKGLQCLPAMSITVTQLLELTQQDGSDVEQVARTVAQDPALSARLLRVANSPFFGLAGEIDSINQACMVLGMNTVRNLAVAVGVGSCFNNDRNEQASLWRLAMEKAVAAQALARRCGQNSEVAFTAGLLRDLGKMVMLSCFAEAMQKTIAYQNAHGCDLNLAEQAIFGMNHRELGGMLAKLWGLPLLIRQVIAGQHEAAEAELQPMLDIVTLVDLLCSGVDMDSADGLFQSLPQALVMRLGLDSESVGAWLKDVEANRSMADLLV